MSHKYIYRDGEHHRLSQPIGKQYSNGLGTEASLMIRNEILDQQVKILKKAQEDGKEVVREVFLELVDEFKSIIPVKSIRELFNISKSTYYRWKQRLVETCLTENEEIIIKLCNDTTFNYGYRMITGILKRDGYPIGKNTLQRIMQRFNLQCRVKQKRQNLYRGKEALVANNVMNRNFKATRPLEKLSTDITDLPWGETNFYLSSIMDLYDGQIIAYTLRTIQDIEFVSNTANQLPKIMSECTIQIIKIRSIHRVYTKHHNNTRIQAKLGFMSPVQYRESQIPAYFLLESHHAGTLTLAPVFFENHSILRG